MALEESIASNVGTLSSFLGESFRRWAKVAVAIRSQGTAYDPKDFWKALMEQFVDNWDTLTEVSSFPGYPVIPTVDISAAYNALNGVGGSAFVRQNLTNASFQVTDLEAFGGEDKAVGAVTVRELLRIPAASVTAAKAGDIDGKVFVKLTANAPARGTYRGMVLVDPDGATAFQACAWIVVVAQ